MAHEYLRQFSFLGFIGRLLTMAWTAFLLWRSHVQRVYLFIGNQTNTSIARGVLMHCQRKGIEVVLRVSGDVVPSPSLIEFAKEYYEYIKYDVLSQCAHETVPQTNIGDFIPLYTFVFSDEEEKATTLKTQKCTRE